MTKTQDAPASPPPPNTHAVAAGAEQPHKCELCPSPAVGWFILGRPTGAFDSVLRCKEHAGNAVMTKAVG